MKDVIYKTIHVDSVADNGKKITLIYGKEKYGFWKNKQDGSETKAYTQYKALRVESGQEYPIAVKEEAKSFTNDQGKLINFTERNLMFFATKEAGEGKVPHQAENTVEHNFEHKNEPVDLNVTVANMRAWATKIEKRVEGLETLVTALTSKQAVDLHQTLGNTSKTITPQQAAKELDGVIINEVPWDDSDFRVKEEDLVK